MTPEEFALSKGVTPIDIGTETPEMFAQSRGVTPQDLSTASNQDKEAVFGYLTGNKNINPEGINFLERLKMSFGDENEINQLKQIEGDLGLRGKIDIGDLADVAGTSLPMVGGILGTPFGPGGIAIGTGLGETAKRGVGQLLGVREDKGFGEEALETGISTAVSYGGAKVLNWLAKTPVVQKFKDWAIKAMPERLYKTFFEVSKRDLSKMWTTKELTNLKMTQPELFNEYVKNGVIKVSGKNLSVNPTLARELLERGVWGSPEKMARYSYSKMLELENKILPTVKKATVELDNSMKEGAINFLKDFMSWQKNLSYKTDSTSFNAKKAMEILNKLEGTKGNKFTGDVVLELRRFADDLVNYSPLRQSKDLADKYIPIKEVADDMRGVLKSIKGVGESMNEYRIMIEAFNSLVDYGYRTGKTKIVSLADALLGGGGLVAGGPGVGIGAMGLFRLLQLPTIQTGIGQALYKGGNLAEKASPYTVAPLLEGLKDAFDINQ